MREDKEKLFKIAIEKEGMQAADWAYYTLLFLPLSTGIIGLFAWGYAILFRPTIPEERLNPLLYTSIVLVGGPAIGCTSKRVANKE